MTKIALTVSEVSVSLVAMLIISAGLIQNLLKEAERLQSTTMSFGSQEYFKELT